MRGGNFSSICPSRLDKPGRACYHQEDCCFLLVRKENERMDYRQTAKLVLNRLKESKGDGRWDDHLSLATWEWPQGVAMYAMLKVFKASGDEALLKEIKDWYDGHIARGLPGRNINTTAPLLGLTMLYEITGNEAYRPYIQAWAEWVMNGLPRTQEGGFQHITSDCVNEQQLWDDTLFMTCLFLYRAGCALQCQAWQDEAKYQFLLHIKYLHCDQNGLWYHGWCFLGRHHFGEAFWARGNSWITAGAIDFAQWLPQGDPVKRAVEETWKEQCRALLALQDEKTGLWHTLLDHADSYLETSASAAIAYGLLKGCRLGLLDCREQAMKAAQGVIGMIAPDGLVEGVSYGTPMGNDLDFYRNIPIQPTAYGQGLVFLMLTELMGE